MNNNQISYQDFVNRVKAATVSVYSHEIVECGDGDVCISIDGEGIEFSVQVWVGSEWNGGRFYDTQESYSQKCPTVVDEDGDVVSERDLMSDVMHFVEDKIRDVITSWWIENEQELIDSREKFWAVAGQ